MMSENKRKEVSLTEQLQVFSENASLHGLRVVGDPHAWMIRRIIWGLAVASFLALVIMQAVRLIQLALNPGVQTTTELDNGAFPIQLPAITICNNNNFRASVKDHYFKLYSNGTINQTEFYIKTAHKLNEMVPMCGHSNEGDPNCTTKFKQVITDKGVCYMFNADPKKPLNVSLTGISTSWFFVLNVQDHEYSQSTFNTFAGSGFKILIGRQEEYPAVQSYGFSLAAGEETLVGLTRSRVTMDERMNCYNTRDPTFVNPLLYHKYYTEQTCHQECITHYLEKNCGCRYFFHNGTERACDEPDRPCFSNASVNYPVDELGLSKCNCPPECDTLIYETKISHARFPATYAMHYIQHYFNIPVGAPQRENLALLVVYYETPRVVITKQTFAYDFSKLGGDLGGYMGLMLGASFLTLMEVADLVCRCVHLVLTRMSSPKPRTMSHVDNSTPKF